MPTDKKTQCEELLKHFRSGGSITSMNAFRLFSVTQLGARLKELEAKGYRFNRPRIKLPSSGKTVCKYSLIRE